MLQKIKQVLVKEKWLPKPLQYSSSLSSISSLVSYPPQRKPSSKDPTGIPAPNSQFRTLTPLFSPTFSVLLPASIPQPTKSPFPTRTQLSSPHSPEPSNKRTLR